MAVGLTGLPPLQAVSGIRLGTASAGIKRPGRRDLVVIELTAETVCAALFTRNAFQAAPVQVARRHLAAGAPRYLLINTGNANAGTGQAGIQDAEQCCAALAALADCAPDAVLPFSTGVIGESLPVSRIQAALPAAIGALGEDEWPRAAAGIMTTDTVPKGVSRVAAIEGHTITVTGIAKGSGMIRPDMATMLAFIATDAAADPAWLQGCLARSAAVSFNCITVDGDTSTNDACVLMATGRQALPDTDAARQQLEELVRSVCVGLAEALIRDGEGASKFITIQVEGAADALEGRRVADAVAHSPLVKTAFFASDPNWGRILAAVGRAGITDLNLDRVSIYLGAVCIVRAGARAADYLEAEGRTVMAQDEITVRIELDRGSASTQVWTCDLSYDYVRINAEYRT
ncbi:MAG: bifunctional ornithine acetyltransferase/N-acetylglutamate synthase [Chromatiales bacterium 21-64-14]|nr:MAG: bifunctional ornithine acetyltransferase/N-acetylglutamate synthase [Chromatiales bacterium 21-64-14]HQU14888.1 bifunctional glutamate N-acetyltransferase/amino-acid acetyltransferase ArgJ [Gammaproteobacteria bacterium]